MVEVACLSFSIFLLLKITLRLEKADHLYGLGEPGQYWLVCLHGDWVGANDITVTLVGDGGDAVDLAVTEHW